MILGNPMDNVAVNARTDPEYLAEIAPMLPVCVGLAVRDMLVEAAPPGAELWLDGGHNPHGGAAIAQSMADLEERSSKPLYLICGMLKTKDAAETKNLIEFILSR